MATGRGSVDPHLASSMERDWTCLRTAVQVILGVAVIGLAMVNGGLLSSYFRKDAVYPPHRTPSKTAITDEMEPETRDTSNNLDAAVVAAYPNGQSYPLPNGELEQYDRPLNSESPMKPSKGAWHRKRNKAFVEGCTDPECLWYDHHMETKLDSTIDPCDDFYGHVCSSKWFAPYGKPTYEMESIEKLMSCLDLNLRVEKHSPLRWTRNSAFLYDACLRSNGSQLIRDQLLVRLRLRPVTKAPSVIFRIGLQEMMPKLQSEYLENVKVHPLASVYMAPSGPAKGYVPYVDSPQLLLKRFFLRYPNRTEGDYQRLVESVLTDMDDPALVASKVVHIEKRLSNIVSGTPERMADWKLTPDRMARMGNATLRWLAHLFPASFGGRLNVRILDQNYVSQLVDILKHICTPEDVADYFHFRTLVEYSSFLNITSLIPLSYETHVSGVPLRVQGCLHMVENMYKHGLRMLGTEAIGGNLGVWRIPFEYEMGKLFEDVKDALSRYVRRWFSSNTVDKALRKVRSMELAHLGSKVSSPSLYAQSTPELRSLSDFSRLVRDTVSRDFNETNNLDFMHRISVFSTSVEYNSDTNSLFVPHALITLPVLQSETLHPIFLPIVGAKVLHGAIAAIDNRGSESPTDEGNYKTWWSLYDQLTFENRSRCFKEQLDRAVKMVYPQSSRLDFLDNFIADNAILEPLYDIYRKRVIRRYPDGMGRADDEVKEDKLFFYVYAMGHCEAPGTETVQLKYRHATPARLRVNGALANFQRFRKTFKCRAGKPMSPVQRCMYWRS